MTAGSYLVAAVYNDFPVFCCNRTGRSVAAKVYRTFALNKHHVSKRKHVFAREVRIIATVFNVSNVYCRNLVFGTAYRYCPSLPAESALSLAVIVGAQICAHITYFRFICVRYKVVITQHLGVCCNFCIYSVKRFISHSRLGISFFSFDTGIYIVIEYKHAHTLHLKRNVGGNTIHFLICKR